MKHLQRLRLNLPLFQVQSVFREQPDNPRNTVHSYYGKTRFWESVCVSFAFADGHLYTQDRNELSVLFVSEAQQTILLTTRPRGSTQKPGAAAGLASRRCPPSRPPWQQGQPPGSPRGEQGRAGCGCPLSTTAPTSEQHVRGQAGEKKKKGSG